MEEEERRTRLLLRILAFSLALVLVSFTSEATRGRAVIYAACGLLCEVVFTSIGRLRRHGGWKLEGYTSLWAAPLYASCAYLFEPLYHLLYAVHEVAWPLRGALYVLGVHILESAYLFYVEEIFEIKPWRYRGRWSALGGRTQLAYAPFWFVGMLATEYLVDFLKSNHLSPSP